MCHKFIYSQKKQLNEQNIYELLNVDELIGNMNVLCMMTRKRQDNFLHTMGMWSMVFILRKLSCNLK